MSRADGVYGLRELPPAKRKRLGATTRFGLPCPLCGEATAVIDSRPVDNYIRRNRVCRTCRARFSTREIIVVDGAPRITDAAQPKVRQIRRSLQEALDAISDLIGDDK